MHAVSPVIATLILIVIAIVGAVAVGLIMSRVSADTSKAANANQVASNADDVLNVGGSSTIYPMIESALPTFESQYNVQLNVVLSSSGQGMEGVMLGALDVGAASSYPAVTSAQAYASTNYPAVNLVATQIGGSGETVIANSGLGSAAAGDLGFLQDASGNICYAITQSALAEIYEAAPGPAGAGYFELGPTSCADGYLTSGASIINNVGASQAAVPGTHTGSIAVVYRSDSSGTQDTFSAYIGVGDKSFYAGIGESGNQGVLSTVQAGPQAAYPGGLIGFTDLGFSDGAAVGTAGTVADGVAIMQVATTTTAVTDLTGTSTAYGLSTATGTNGGTGQAGSGNFYPLAAYNGQSISLISKQILAGLQAPAASIFPDSAAASGSTLVRNFYLVTNGTPSPIEQDFINFFTQGTAQSESYATSNGFFNLYQINSGA